MIGLVGVHAAPLQTAELDYLHGFEAGGDFAGDCEVAGFHFNQDTKRSLSVVADQAVLTLHQTWQNGTRVEYVLDHPLSEVPTRYIRTTERTETTIEVPNGTLQFEWTPNAHFVLKRNHDDEPWSLIANLHGIQWQASAARQSLYIGDRYYSHNWDGGIAWAIQSIGGMARWTETDQSEVRVTGNGQFRFDSLNLKGEDFEFEMPPYEQVFYAEDSDIADSILYTDARLEVWGLETVIPAESGALACSGLDWNGQGAVTYRAATGNATLENNTIHSFENREFTMSGEIHNFEELEKVNVDWGNQIQSVVTSQGKFVIGTDYNPVSNDDTRLSTSAQITIFASIVTLAAVIWKFGPACFSLFTRLEKHKALNHPIRRALHEVAVHQPGTSLADMVRKTGKSYSTIRHHARQLARIEMVSTIRFTKEVYLFPTGTPRHRARKLISLQKEPIKALMSQVGQADVPLKVVRSKLIEAFEKSPSWATRVISEAEANGLVSRHRSNGGVLLSAKVS